VLRDKEWKGQAQAGQPDMSSSRTLNDTLTKAIREKDARRPTLDPLIRGKVGERRTAKASRARWTTRSVQDVISVYRSRCRRRLPDYEKAGEAAAGGPGRPAAVRDRSTWSAGCQGTRQPALRALVKERLAALGITDAKAGGPPGRPTS